MTRYSKPVDHGSGFSSRSGQAADRFRYKAPLKQSKDSPTTCRERARSERKAETDLSSRRVTIRNSVATSADSPQHQSTRSKRRVQIGQEDQDKCGSPSNHSSRNNGRTIGRVALLHTANFKSRCGCVYLRRSGVGP